MEMINVKENYLAKVDEKFLLEDNIKFIVQFNGKQKNYNSKKDTTESLY